MAAPNQSPRLLICSKLLLPFVVHHPLAVTLIATLSANIMTILITGAAGRTSGYVIRALLQGPQPPALRLLVRSEKSKEKVQVEYGVKPADVVVADYLEQKALRAALDGVDVVFHNGPSFHAQETAMGIAVVDAAKQAGVKHFVFSSVHLSLLTKLLNHKVKLEYVISPHVS